MYTTRNEIKGLFYRSTQLRSLAAVDTDINQLAAEVRAAIIELGPEHKNIAHHFIVAFTPGI